SMVRDDKIDLPGTEFQLDFSLAKEVDILRKKSATVASGSTLKGTTKPGSGFLKTGSTKITVTAGGGTASEGPTLDIVDEDTASSSMNHVLIGGPVANALVAALVESGDSTVDWYASDGDIEVISDAPASGFTSIIVAGKTRDETAAAAQALADAL
ncbi:MAG: S-layer protein, partial [Euryarchaeota archaeon]|nr:S-layer protein [Euryarchaeota archaeon]